MGGAQRYVRTMARGARAAGWNVTVAAGPDGGGALFTALAGDGIPCRTLRALRREIRPADDLRAVAEVRRLVRELRPNVLHVNSSKAGLVAALALVGLRPRPRHVFTAHGWIFLEPGRRQGLYRQLERFAGRRRDATVVLSPMERDAALAAGAARKEQLRVIPLGVAPVPHDRAAARGVLVGAGIPADAIVIGCVANAYPVKNLPALIAAFARQPDASMHLVLVGNGTERLAGGARVHLFGAREDARPLMDGFDLFVLPSLKEGLPASLLEAMEAGLPCLATSVGGIPSVIADGMNGWLAAPDQLADGLARALAARADWPRIGRAATDTVHSLFTEERMIRDTVGLYRSLIGSSPGSS